MIRAGGENRCDGSGSAGALLADEVTTGTVCTVSIVSNVSAVTTGIQVLAT
jgi:hypothetical protein